MVRVFIPLFIATICVGLATADPTAKVTFKKVDIQVFDNPYFGEWQGEIHPPGELMSFKIPMKKDIPETMMMRGTGFYAGSPIGEMDLSICEAFDDQTIGKGILDAGTPKGKFPKKCPLKASDDYMISKYMVSTDTIPPGLPDGTASAEVEIYEPGKEPYVKMRFEADLTHKIPGLGR